MVAEHENDIIMLESLLAPTFLDEVEEFGIIGMEPNTGFQSLPIGSPNEAVLLVKKTELVI